MRRVRSGDGMQLKMQVEPTGIEGLVVLERDFHQDLRGSFRRAYCEAELAAVGIDAHASQINHSVSVAPGTLRGLHFQYPPYAEMKIISCLVGAIYDVGVDLRPDSPTYLQSAGVVLRAGEARSLVVPEGFAHGFLSLEPDSHLLYIASSPYMPDSEDGIRYDDPLIGVDWPQEPSVLSPKDASWLPIEARLGEVATRMRDLFR